MTAQQLVRHVESHLVVDVEGPAVAALAVAVAAGPPVLDDELDVRLDGRPIPATELGDTAGGRLHRVEVTTGRVTVDYRATVGGRATPAVPTPAEELACLRPSRYAESDRLEAVARAEFAGISEPRALLDAVSSWVGARLDYEPGSSRPTDGAVDTLLQRRGVCRDYAHLVVALLRALDVPARLVAVYAPGLTPMDFHAVVEAAVDGHWYATDATLLAPRRALLRIATGRDAADTAFLSTYGASVELREISVSAWTDGPLPSDDLQQAVELG